MPTTPTSDPVPSENPADLLYNAGALDAFVNSTDATFDDRLGVERPTLSGLSATFPDASANAASAESNAALAEAAKFAAETARDAAFVNASVYADVATGLAAVSDGQQFQVAAADGMQIHRYRRDAGPVAVLVASYPTAAAAAPAQAAYSAVQPLLSTEYLGRTAGAVVGNGNTASAATFVLPVAAAHDGYVDQVEIYGGAVGGAVKLRVFNLVAGVFVQTGADHLLTVAAGVLNTFSVYFPVLAGQYVGIYQPLSGVSYTTGTPTDTRAWRTLGDVTSVDTATATRAAEINIRLRSMHDRFTGTEIAAAISTSSLSETAMQDWILRDVRDALQNPLRDCVITLVGDSITWGMTVTGGASENPRTGVITDPRNNLTSPSWANKLRKWGALLACGALNETTPTAGASAYSNAVSVAPWDDQIAFVVLDSAGAVVSNPNDTNSGATLKTYIDIPASGSVSFDYVGGDITIRHSGWEDSAYSFYVDGVLKTTYAGTTGMPATLRLSTALTGISFGPHTVRITAGSARVFRFEAVERSKTFALYNNGIVGRNTKNWLPTETTNPLLVNAVPANTTHIFIQLGTNDRDYVGYAGTISIPGIPAGAAGTYQNLIKIVAWIKENRPLAQIILMAPPHFPTAGTYANSGDIAQAIKRVATLKNVAFIDNFSPTAELEIAGDTWLDDGLHPNDSGHRTIFKNILNKLLGA